MALTKHEKLARGIKTLLHNLEVHYQKTAAVLKVIQFHFCEIAVVAGCPEITQRALSLMTRVCICGIHRFSSDQELCSTIRSLPHFSCVFPQPVLFRSQIHFSLPDTPENAKWVIPWSVRVIPPSKTFQQLAEAKLEALLYSASEDEMFDWIDWFEHEDQANTLLHQLLAIREYYRGRAPFEAKLNQLALPFYKEAVLEFYKKIEFPKVFKTLSKIDFAPKENSSIAESYERVVISLRARDKWHWQDFQRFWRNKLRELMFADVKWTQKRQELALAEYFPQKQPVHPKNKNPRRGSSGVIDRQTYAKFIQYFADQFLADIAKNKVAGEIALLLWIMIYIARELSKTLPVTRLLELTTADIDDRILLPDSEEIELSCGLADLIKQYIGDMPLQRNQKLFPSLTMDKLEDHCRRASKILLPPNRSAVLPEALLGFPHAYKNLRMAAKLRKLQQRQLFSVYLGPISRKELKKRFFATPSK